MSTGETPIPFNEYAADLNKTTLELIEQVLLKHSRAVLEGMHSHIVHRNNRITALERDLARLTEENEALRKKSCGHQWEKVDYGLYRCVDCAAIKEGS